MFFFLRGDDLKLLEKFVLGTKGSTIDEISLKPGKGPWRMELAIHQCMTDIMTDFNSYITHHSETNISNLINVWTNAASVSMVRRHGKWAYVSLNIIKHWRDGVTGSSICDIVTETRNNLINVCLCTILFNRLEGNPLTNELLVWDLL